MAHLSKIAMTSKSRSSPSELETNIATAIHELETNTPDMKSALRPLQFVSAKEVGDSYCVLFQKDEISQRAGLEGWKILIQSLIREYG